MMWSLFLLLVWSARRARAGFGLEDALLEHHDVLREHRATRVPRTLGANLSLARDPRASVECSVGEAAVERCDGVSDPSAPAWRASGRGSVKGWGWVLVRLGFVGACDAARVEFAVGAAATQYRLLARPAAPFFAPSVQLKEDSSRRGAACTRSGRPCTIRGTRCTGGA